MPSCAVAIYLDTQRNTKGTDVIFHQFPQQNGELCKEWLRRCKRKGIIKPKIAKICSDPFLLSDYIESLENSLLGLLEKKNLKESSVPIINVPFMTIDNVTL